MITYCTVVYQLLSYRLFLVPDYFVKITLMQNDTILDKRRTHVVKKSTCPVYNENLVFPVDVGTIRSLVLICDIIRYDSKLKQEKIGSVVLGNHSIHRQVTPHEIQHFNEMLTSPQRHIAEWHKLVQWYAAWFLWGKSRLEIDLLYYFWCLREMIEDLGNYLYGFYIALNLFMNYEYIFNSPKELNTWKATLRVNLFHAIRYPLKKSQN